MMLTSKGRRARFTARAWIETVARAAVALRTPVARASQRVRALRAQDHIGGCSPKLTRPIIVAFES